jgi:hypothetical protein
VIESAEMLSPGLRQKDPLEAEQNVAESGGTLNLYEPDEDPADKVNRGRKRKTPEPEPNVAEQTMEVAWINEQQIAPAVRMI